MAFQITVSADGTRRTITDDLNPRVHVEEVKCCVCRQWFDADRIIWATPDGTLSTAVGDAYCEADAPEQPDYPPAPTVNGVAGVSTDALFAGAMRFYVQMPDATPSEAVRAAIGLAAELETQVRLQRVERRLDAK